VIWKPIDEDPKYEVSDTGLVRNAKTGRLMALDPGTGGVLKVSISTHNVKSRHAVHRLVARAFVEDFEADRRVQHRDKKVRNNRADNLVMGDLLPEKEPWE
jgi:hypothetical protein